MARTVHVLVGTTAAGSFKLTGIAADRKDVVAVSDSLSCGPLPPITDVRRWIDARKTYWQGLVGGAYEGTETLYSEFFGFEPSDEVVLWLGTGLANQIALAWLPAFLRAIDFQLRELKVVQFDRNPRGVEILDLGMLLPEQIAAHLPPMLVTGEQLAVLDVVWQALIATDPDDLVGCLDDVSRRSPFLARALHEGLTRYPDARSGLNAWDARILRNVRKVGPKAGHVIGDVLIDAFDELRAGIGGRDMVGDGWLFDRMVRLADPKLQEPLLEMTGSRVEYRDTEVRLTPFGQRVLDGQANVVDANGIDDWVFGVHLQSAAGRVWFHQDGALIRR
jgi:hypothetical protein